MIHLLKRVSALLRLRRSAVRGSEDDVDHPAACGAETNAGRAGLQDRAHDEAPRSTRAEDSVHTRHVHHQLSAVHIDLLRKRAASVCC